MQGTLIMFSGLCVSHLSMWGMSTPECPWGDEGESKGV